MKRKIVLLVSILLFSFLNIYSQDILKKHISKDFVLYSTLFNDYHFMITSGDPPIRYLGSTAIISKTEIYSLDDSIYVKCIYDYDKSIHRYQYKVDRFIRYDFENDTYYFELLDERGRQLEFSYKNNLIKPELKFSYFDDKGEIESYKNYYIDGNKSALTLTTPSMNHKCYGWEWKSKNSDEIDYDYGDLPIEIYYTSGHIIIFFFTAEVYSLVSLVSQNNDFTMYKAGFGMASENTDYLIILSSRDGNWELKIIGPYGTMVYYCH